MFETDFDGVVCICMWVLSSGRGRPSFIIVIGNSEHDSRGNSEHDSRRTVQTLKSVGDREKPIWKVQA